MGEQPHTPRSDTPHPDIANASDWHGVGAVVGEAVEQIVAPVEGMHRAIADPWLRAVGPQGRAFRASYHAGTAAVYESVRVVGALAGAAVERGGVHSLGTNHRVARGINSIGNALWGDRLNDRGSGTDGQLSVRAVDGSVIPVGAVADAFPQATDSIVILIHGLGETEQRWLHRGGEQRSLAECLLGPDDTAVCVRYNSGRSVATNGDSLARCIEQLVGEWPVSVKQIALVGYSMGGLVARRAVQSSVVEPYGWIEHLSQVIAVGTPHLGSPIEKGAAGLTAALRLSPQTRPLGDFVGRRSRGIKDLRFGSLSDADWVGVGDDTLVDPVADAPFPASVQQRFVAGAVSANHAGLVAKAFGDIVVGLRSASGRSRRRNLAADDVAVIAGRSHFTLLDDPETHQTIRQWINPEPGGNRPPDSATV